MPEPNVKPFDENDFKSEKCKFNYIIYIVPLNDNEFHNFWIISDVKELVQDCVGGAALQQCKSKIQAYSEQTASSLKKHVYANYMQFIETAKEISRMIVNNTPNDKQRIFTKKCFSVFYRFGIRDVPIVTSFNRTAKYFINIA